MAQKREEKEILKMEMTFPLLVSAAEFSSLLSFCLLHTPPLRSTETKICIYNMCSLRVDKRRRKLGDDIELK